MNYNIAKKLQIKLVAVAFVALLLVISACSGNDSEKSGVIIYDIEYLDDVRSNPLIGMLPSKMSVIFGSGKIKTQIEGMMGFFNFTYIADTHTGENYTLLRLVDKKYKYHAKSGEIAYGYDHMRDFRIEETTETKEIMGYDCKKGIAYSAGFEEGGVPFYYTDEICIVSPNINNPYKKVEATLMEFQIVLNGIHMKVTANRMIYKNIREETFGIPEGYKKVKKKEMHKILEPYFTSSRSLKIPMKR